MTDKRFIDSLMEAFDIINPDQNNEYLVGDWLSAIDGYLDENITDWSRVMALKRDLVLTEKEYSVVLKKIEDIIKNAQKMMPTLIPHVQEKNPTKTRPVKKLEGKFDGWLQQIEAAKRGISIMNKG